MHKDQRNELLGLIEDTKRIINELQQGIESKKFTQSEAFPLLIKAYRLIKDIENNQKRMNLCMGIQCDEFIALLKEVKKIERSLEAEFTIAGHPAIEVLAQLLDAYRLQMELIIESIGG